MPKSKHLFISVKTSVTCLILLLLSLQISFAFDLVPDRRSEIADGKFGWLVATTPISIQGIGTTVPITGIFSNVYKSTDLMAVKSVFGEELDITAATFMELPAFTENVLLYGGYFESQMPIKRYQRSIDSDPEEFILPYQRTKGIFSQIKLNFYERRLEAYLQYNQGGSRPIKVFDADGNEFSNIDTSESTFETVSVGTMIDLTDSRHDPRQGIRFGIERKFPRNKNQDNSDYFVTDMDLALYIPFFQKDTLVFNIYRSMATVTREGLVDEAQLRAEKGLGCVLGMPLYEQCYAAETKQILEIQSANKYGSAASIGGSNRLRAYNAGRFRAGNSAFYGMEYRYNFSSEEKEVNLFFLGGIKTLFQLAAFAEAGTVNDDASQLTENLKPSYGIGFRAIISSLVYRFDIATGDEGVGFTVFIDYPFELNPITG
jgi:hypothetical protein